MPRSTVITTAKRIRRQASKGYRHEQRQLLIDVSDTDVVLTFGSSMPLGMAVGVELGMDFEQMLVVAINTPANQVTVVRGFQDTEALPHRAGDMIDIGARFSLVDVRDAMINEICGWGSQLYQVVNTEETVAAGQLTLELPVEWVDCLGIIEVIQSEDTGGGTVWPRLPCKFIRGDVGAGWSGAPTSGMLLRFTEPIRSGIVLVTAARPFVFGGGAYTLGSPDDLIQDYHLTPGMLELVELGAKRRLIMDEMSGKGARHAQDESRRAEETPMGSLVPVGQLQAAYYTQRMNQVIGQLRREYPIRIT